MFQLTLPMGLEELVALKAGSLQFDQSSKLLAQFQVVDQVISTKDNQTKLQVKKKCEIPLFKCFSTKEDYVKTLLNLDHRIIFHF